MCQLCAIKDIAAKETWPKPLVSSIKDLDFLVETAHTDFEDNKAACAEKTTIPTSLLEVLRLLATSLQELENDRVKWWTDPKKKEQRKRLEATYQTESLTKLQKINNTTSDTIEAMSARLGTFVKWSLSMNGGVWELMHLDKVSTGDAVKAVEGEEKGVAVVKA
ncbi:hypothetical protein LTR56_020141 [Elasticomyces elasticus]|nr:hypothetical protein LTR56_020141 [Elasticomyces elasticus]KAK3633603.1 hypothetical protein LTR22_020039 [Elasticomyces elasticus]KAK4910788.1 hypothetical protein LTR49_020562 [Elasticomyces elasticus]KAK5721910.1 hypothetical protein LTR15_006504 [Elasticomyces elasticus]KAK5760450.1 hypothetical protein LTS12_009494 [Elasticomyces elasticus]